MNPNSVYSLLVDANPVPDADNASELRLERRPAPAPDPGSQAAQFTAIEPVGNTTDPDRRHRWMLAAAAAAIVIVAFGALMFTRSEPEPVDRADEPTEPLPPTQEELALATAVAFYTAVNAGDIDTVMVMTNPDFSNVAADRQMWEMHAVTVRVGEPWTIGACETIHVDADSIDVGCGVIVSDPVFEELGIAELVAAVRVFDDQTTRWLPFQGADVGAANQAYADYLRTFRPVEYEAVCNPTEYEPGTINADSGLALTAACAELWVPLGDDVAQLIRDGTVPLVEWVTWFDQQCVDTVAALSEPGLTEAEYQDINDAAFSEMRAIPPPDQMADTAAGLVDGLQASTDSTERTQTEIEALDQQLLDAMRSLGISDACIGNPGG